MKRAVGWLAAGCAFALQVRAANTWYVDDANRAGATRDGSAENPYGTIQEAIDAEGTKDKDTILVRPGEYKTGSAESGSSYYRVKITKGVIVRATSDNPADTHIVGDLSDENPIGCIAYSPATAVKACVEGFTLRNGRAVANSKRPSVGYNVLGNGKRGYFHFAHCVISNCVNESNADGILQYMTLHRCWVSDNDGDIVVYGCTVDNSLITRNNSMGAKNSIVFNSTIAGNRDSALQSASANHLACNSIFALNGRYQGDVNKAGAAVNSVTTEADTSVVFATFTGGLSGAADTNLFFAPLFDDYHLLADSQARTVACDVADLYANCTVPYEGYVWRDYDGIELPASGTVLPGAFQGASRTPASGPYVVNDTCSRTAGSPVPRAAGLYAYATAWPTQWCVTAANPATHPLMYVTDSLVYMGTWGTTPGYANRFSGYDECVWMMPPPVGTNKQVTAVCATQQMYVNGQTGDDEYDGTAAVAAADAATSKVGPKKTLQGMVQTVKGMSNRGPLRVNVAPGVYREGYAQGGGAFSNRLAVASCDKVHFVATEGAEKTIIVGGTDPTAAEADQGCGNAALRCLFSYSFNVGFRGFTLTGGRTTTKDGGDYTSVGAAVYVNYPVDITDSIISNNVAYGNVIHGPLMLERCLIADNVSLSGSLVSATKTCLSGCLLRNNATAAEGMLISGIGSQLTSCVIDGSSGSQTVSTKRATFLNTIFYGCGEKCVSSTIATLAGCLMDGSSGPSTDESVSGSAHFVNATQGDYRLFPDSAARGILTVGETFAQQVAFSGLAGTDFTGYPLAETDVCGQSGASAPTCAGAYLTVLPNAVYFAAADAAGALVKVNDRTPAADEAILAPGDVVTLLPDTTGRPCRGVRINGSEEVLEWSDTLIAFTYDEVVAMGGLSIEPVCENAWYADANDGSDETGIGFSPATAFHSLSNALKHAASGDTVYAAEGEYDDSPMLNGTNVYRVVIGAGVTLKASGAREKTIIAGAAATIAEDSGGLGLGSDAVRCAYIGSNGRLEGFTLREGHSVVTTSGDSGIIRGRKRDASFVVDCVITNNTGLENLFYEVSLVNCEVVNNYALNNGICRNSRLYNSLVARNSCNSSTLLYVLSFENSTYAADNVVRTKKSASDFTTGDGVRPVVNSVFCGTLEKRCAVSNCVLTAALPDDVSADYNNVVTNVALLGLSAETGYRPSIALQSAALDRADYALVKTAICGTNDLAGNPRVANGAMDAGCYEADWRSTYAQALGKGVTVTAASSAVTWTNGHVFVPGGAEIAFDWTGGVAERNATWQLALRIAGTGTCKVYLDGEETPAFVQTAAGDCVMAVPVNGVATKHVRIAFEPGDPADPTAGVTLLKARIPHALVIIVR